MSERSKGRDANIHFQRKAYLPERPGILTAPSEDLIKRRLQSQQDRARTLAPMLEAQAQKLLSPTEVEEPTVEIPSAVLSSGEFTLPIEAHKQEILDAFEHNKALIIISDTGSGKSTQVPQYLLEAGYRTYVVQGRRAMVDGLSDRIQEELNSRLGEEAAEGLVSSIHGGRTRTFENSKIIVLTAATLTMMMPSIVAQYGNEKVAFIADEIHEDDQHVELSTGVSSIEVARHPEWRMAGMSATIDPEPLKIPFGRITNFEHPEKVDVPVLRIEGRVFPLDIREIPDKNPAEIFIEHGADHKIAMLGERGFEPLRRMREEVVAAYEAREPGSSSRIIFREYTGKTSPFQRTEIARLASELSDEMQLVVLATPAARSGITIPGLTFVAIGGLTNREKRYEDRSRGIVPDPMSRSEVYQFLSRGGRDVAGGVGYLGKPMPSRRKSDEKDEFAKIYPFMPMDDRPEYPRAAIFNSNLSELILNAANAGIDPDLVNKHIINEQDASVLDAAVRRLRSEFGALDDDKKVTETGRLMSRFPVAPELSRGLAEAMRNGRSRQQLARMAVISTAIDAGGFQVLKASDKAEWKKFLNSGSDDDFMAQLDFILAMRQEGFRGGPSHDGATYAYLNDLDYSKILGVEEPTDKIMRRMGIDAEGFEIEPPSTQEIQEIRDDFTSGMYGLTYRELRKRNDPARYFKSVHGGDRFPERTLAKQSNLSVGSGELVTGMPQFYMTIAKGKETQVDILGSTLKVSPEVVGRYALAGRLVEYIEVPGTSRMDGGMVTESEQAMFGSLKVGAHKSVKRRGEIPQESQRRLIETVQNKPGFELRSLRDLARDLADLRRLMPSKMLEAYRRPDAPADITLTTIEQKLKFYAGRTRSAQEVDELIGVFSEQQGQSIDLYYQSSAREEIHRRSPQSITVAGEPLDLHYDNGVPHIKKISNAQLAALDGPLFIDEGFEQRREVLIQVKKEGGRGTRRISVGEYLADTI